MSIVNVHDIDGKSYSVDSAELIFNPAVYGVVIRDGRVLLLPTNFICVGLLMVQMICRILPKMKNSI